MGDDGISKSAMELGTRYGRRQLAGLLGDLVLLSRCDLIVGTFSSQISRMAYELMQGRFVDASDR